MTRPLAAAERMVAAYDGKSGDSSRGPDPDCDRGLRHRLQLDCHALAPSEAPVDHGRTVSCPQRPLRRRRGVNGPRLNVTKRVSKQKFWLLPNPAAKVPFDGQLFVSFASSCCSQRRRIFGHERRTVT